MNVYIVLGSSIADYGAVVGDLLENSGWDPQAVMLYFSKEEAPKAAVLEPLAASSQAAWGLREMVLQAPMPPQKAEALFFFISGQDELIDTLEALPTWLKDNELSLTRIITFVDGAWIAKKPEIKEWYEACIHFSDVALLIHTDKAPVGWAHEYIEHFRKACYPCLMLTPKGNVVENPPLVLDSSVRRLSQAFDEDLELEDTLEAELEDEEGAGAAEEQAVIDIYFQRYSNGHRIKPVPEGVFSKVE